MVPPDYLNQGRLLFRYVNIVSSGKVHTALSIPWLISVVYFVVLLTLMEMGSGATQEVVTHVIYISFDIVAFVGFLVLASSSVLIYRTASMQLRRIKNCRYRGFVLEKCMGKRGKYE